MSTTHTRRHGILATAITAILFAGLAIPAAASAGPIGGLVDRVTDTVNGVTSPSSSGSGSGAPGGAPTGNPPSYSPPLHGSGSHSQGSVAVGDVQPSPVAPISGDPAGGAPTGGEEVVVGRSRGEQTSNGKYRGRVTILALLGQEILGVDSGRGESAHGPLDAIQTQILDAICQSSGNQICLTVLRADSSSTSHGSSNAFEVAGAHVGGPDGVNADVGTSQGNISQSGSCQTANSESGVAAANVGSLRADVLQSSSTSSACRNAAPSQSGSSTVVNLAGYGLPLPAQGCADGTPNASFTALSPVLATACNADDTNGGQVSAPYGSREALSAFVLEAGDSSLVKATTAAAETHTKAPPATPGENPGGGGDNPGGDDPANPASNDGGSSAVKDATGSGGQGSGGPVADGTGTAAGASAGGGTLPFTGADLLILALIGLSVMAAGLVALGLVDRHRKVTA